MCLFYNLEMTLIVRLYNIILYGLQQGFNHRTDRKQDGKQQHVAGGESQNAI